VRPVLLITPPMVAIQHGVPGGSDVGRVPAPHGHESGAQEDLSLALALRLFSPQGVRDVKRALGAALRRPAPAPPSVRHFLAHATEIECAVPGVVAFLQGCAPELQEGLLHPEGLPEGPRFASLRELFSTE